MLPCEAVSTAACGRAPPLAAHGPGMDLVATATATAPIGTLLLSLEWDGVSAFTTRRAGVVVAHEIEVDYFLDTLPASAHRRISQRLRKEDEALIVLTEVDTRNVHALTQFNRFIRHARRAGFAPAAALVPSEDRGHGRYAELADVADAFENALAPAVALYSRMLVLVQTMHPYDDDSWAVVQRGPRDTGYGRA